MWLALGELVQPCHKSCKKWTRHRARLLAARFTCAQAFWRAYGRHRGWTSLRVASSNSQNSSSTSYLKIFELEVENDINARRDNSLGNHTVNRLHSFGVVFVDFDKEYQKTQDFRQNISNPARCSAFFMYIHFLLENKSAWRNLGFTVKKWRRKHDNTSVMCLDWAFPFDYLTFRRHFRQ